jgi:hypothetical protein
MEAKRGELQKLQLNIFKTIDENNIKFNDFGFTSAGSP